MAYIKDFGTGGEMPKKYGKYQIDFSKASGRSVSRNVLSLNEDIIPSSYIECVRCGNCFSPKGTSQRVNYVCDKCYKKEKEYELANKKTKSPKARPIKKCVICGNETPNKYCGQDCYKIFLLRKERRSTYKDVSMAVFIRDNFRCTYCGKSSIEDGVKLVVEHVYPRSKGGGNEEINLTTSCSECNHKKSSSIFPIEILKRIWANNLKRPIQDYDSLKKEFDRQYKIIKTST